MILLPFYKCFGFRLIGKQTGEDEDKKLQKTNAKKKGKKLINNGEIS